MGRFVRTSDLLKSSYCRFHWSDKLPHSSLRRRVSAHVGTSHPSRTQKQMSHIGCYALGDKLRLKSTVQELAVQVLAVLGFFFGR